MLERLTRAAVMSGSILIVLLAIAAVGFVAARLALVTVPLLASLILASVLVPPAAWMERRGVPRSLAALLSVLAVVLFLAGVALYIVPAVVEEVRDALPGMKERVGEVLERMSTWSLPVPGVNARGLVDGMMRMARERSGGILAGLAGGVVALGEMIAAMLLALILVFFFVRDRDRLARWWIERWRRGSRHRLVAAGHAALRTFRGFLQGTAIIALVDAAGIGLGVLLVGVPLVLPITLLTFVCAFVPIVGAVAAGSVAVLVALLSGGITDALWVLAVVIGVQQLEGNLLEPVVLGRQVPLHPVVILVSVGTGVVLGGVLGAFAAVPIVAALAAAWDELRRLDAEAAGA